MTPEVTQHLRSMTEIRTGCLPRSLGPSHQPELLLPSSAVLRLPGGFVLPPEIRDKEKARDGHGARGSVLFVTSTLGR